MKKNDYKGDYSAKEAAQKLNLAPTTFYRKVNDGHIPYRIGQKPKRFPKEAIDAIAEVEAKDKQAARLLFKVSPQGDLWTKREIIKQVHGVEDPIPYKTALEWQKKNKKIFMQVNKGEQILGWVTFLPLAEELITALIEGKMKEEDIAPEAVKKWDDSEISVYIPTLEVAKTTNEPADKATAVCLIRNTIKQAIKLREQYDIENWYAIAPNSEGQKLLEALGFQQVTSLDEGKRKGYKLENLARPSDLLRKFLRRK
jgi:excisionase family DNA binding protein